MERKIIVIAGACRSGSTWMFNAARLLIEASGHPHEWGDWNTTYRHWERLPSRGFLLIKEHKYWPDLAEISDVILTSVRDWTDAAESWYRFQGERLPALQTAERKLWLQSWQDHPRHRFCMVFERMQKEKRSNVDAIHEALGLRLDPETVTEVLARLEAIRPPTGPTQDDTTLLFPNHITLPQCFDSA